MSDPTTFRVAGIDVVRESAEVATSDPLLWAAVSRDAGSRRRLVPYEAEAP